MVARKRDDNKIVAFVRKKEAQRMEVRVGELHTYIMKTFEIKRLSGSCRIVAELIKRDRLVKNGFLITTSKTDSGLNLENFPLFRKKVK